MKGCWTFLFGCMMEGNRTENLCNKSLGWLQRQENDAKPWLWKLSDCFSAAEKALPCSAKTVISACLEGCWGCQCRGAGGWLQGCYWLRGWGGKEEEQLPRWVQNLGVWVPPAKVSTKPAWGFGALGCVHSSHSSGGEREQAALLVRLSSPQLFGVMQLAAQKWVSSFRGALSSCCWRVEWGGCASNLSV